MLVEFAPAKLNLGLWILGRRSDGYHELLSLVVPITLGDELLAEPDRQLRVVYEPPHEFVPDLVSMAARELQEVVGGPYGAKIVVRKRIPVGAGLGGGSSDAAATLRLLCQVWQCAVSHEQLYALAQRLGSDVPFFLLRKPALLRGRGERVQPVPLVLPYTFLVLYPGFSISTAWAYAQLRCSERLRAEPALPWEELLPRLAHEPELFGRYLSNDFEPMLWAEYPQLRQLQRELIQEGAFYAGVTGSGSAIFGIFETEAQAHAAAQRWRGQAIQSFVCQMYREVG